MSRGKGKGEGREDAPGQQKPDPKPEKADVSTPAPAEIEAEVVDVPSESRLNYDKVADDRWEVRYRTGGNEVLVAEFIRDLEGKWSLSLVDGGVGFTRTVRNDIEVALEWVRSGGGAG